jgi:hypothetical protein
LLVLLCSAALLNGLGENEKKAGQMPESENVKPNGETTGGDAVPRLVQVSGRVRLVGSGIFSELVISGEDREWFIRKDEQSKLFEYQQSFVTVEGTETYTDLTFANGLPAGRRYTLKNIKVMSIEPPGGSEE